MSSGSSGRRRQQPTNDQYVAAGATAAATGALSGSLRVISDYVVSKGATSLSLAAVGNAAFASGGVALGIFALYSIGTYAISQMAERQKEVFMVDPSRVYEITSNKGRYLETIPVTYGKHIIYPLSVTTALVDNAAWSNYTPATSASFSPVATKKQAVRDILCVGSGEYDIAVNDVRTGQNPLATTKFMAADDNKLLEPGEVSIVKQGEIFSQANINAVSGVAVAAWSQVQFNPFVVLSTGSIGTLNTRSLGGSGETLFRSLGISIGTNQNGRNSKALPELRKISNPGDTVQRVSINFSFQKRGSAGIRSFLSGSSSWLVSDYLVSGIFIQAKADGTLINEDGTPVPVVDSNGRIVATGGAFPQNITTITGAWAWEHRDPTIRAQYNPGYQEISGVPEAIFFQRNENAGFRYQGIARNRPNNIGFVHMDRRQFQGGSSGHTDTSTGVQNFTVQSADLPLLGDTELVPRENRVWMLMLIPYHLMHSNGINNAGAAQKVVDANLTVAEVKVEKISPDENPYYNSALRNTSRFVFIQVKIPGGAKYDDLTSLFNNAERNKVNAIVCRKLPVYRNGIWTSSVELTRSPIWAIADIFTSSVGGKLDRDLNLIGSEMEDLANYYESQELYYDEVIDSPQGILDIINNIGSLYDFIVYQHGSRWRLSRDFYAHSIAYLIYESDCIDNIDATYQANQENVENILDISYVESMTWLKTSLVVNADYYVVGEDVENVTQFQVRGLTNIDAIRRFARSKLLKSRYRRHILNVTLREIGMILKPNDTIGLVHSYFNEEYSYGQVISSERIGGVDFLTTDTDTDIEGVGRILFRNEDGTQSHQLHAERVSPHRFRVDHDLELVDLITDPTRVRTSYTFAAPNKPLYNRCKVMSVAPNGAFSYNVTMLVDCPEAYISE